MSAALVEIEEKDLTRSIIKDPPTVLVYRGGAIIECWELPRRPGKWYPKYAWNLTYHVLCVWSPHKPPLSEFIIGVARKP
jgi:hypothetical protein